MVRTFSNSKLESGSGPLTGSAERISTTIGAPQYAQTVGTAGCKSTHRPFGPGPHRGQILRHWSSLQCPPATRPNQQEPTTPRRRQLACMGLTKFEDGIRQWPTDGPGGENIYHRRRPLSGLRLSAQQDANRLTGLLDLALAGVRSFSTGAYVQNLQATQPISGSL